MPSATRYTYFVFTANNPTAAQESWLKAELTKHVSYLIFGHEIAPSTGTPHLQGFFALISPATKANQVKKFMRHEMWVGVPTSTEKTPSYWHGYCTKEDSSAFTFGVLPPDDVT